MKIVITNHAKERMSLYNFSEELVKDSLLNPDSIQETYGGRKIAQKRLNAYVIRIIYEEVNNLKVVITTYKAKSDRYEI